MAECQKGFDNLFLFVSWVVLTGAQRSRGRGLPLSEGDGLPHSALCCCKACQSVTYASRSNGTCWALGVGTLPRSHFSTFWEQNSATRAVQWVYNHLRHLSVHHGVILSITNALVYLWHVVVYFRFTWHFLFRSVFLRGLLCRVSLPVHWLVQLVGTVVPGALLAGCWGSAGVALPSRAVCAVHFTGPHGFSQEYWHCSHGGWKINR